jgi:hypothetical protein
MLGIAADGRHVHIAVHIAVHIGVDTRVDTGVDIGVDIRWISLLMGG